MTKNRTNYALDLALNIVLELGNGDGELGQRLDFIMRCLSGAYEVQNITKDEYKTLKEIAYRVSDLREL